MTKTIYSGDTPQGYVVSYYPIKIPSEDSTCLHDRCNECHGTGKDSRGRMCVHMISCPCPKCSPTC
jgi:hypothetical protein